MPGEPIDALGDLITKVGPVGIGTIVNVPCTVTAIGALTNGIPVLTLVSKYPTPASGLATYITISTIYSTQTIVDQ